MPARWGIFLQEDDLQRWRLPKFPNDAVQQLAEWIQALKAQVANGTFVPDRKDDVLSQALGTKEHPSRAW
jgi:hypothetical protein